VLNQRKEVSEPIIICAQQRSGTTLVVKALGETGKCTVYGEVFDPYYFHSKDKSAFFDFKRDLLKEDLNLFFPSPKNQKTIFDKYFHSLKKNATKPYHVVDIKYDSWHHFNPVWHCSEQPPILLNWIMALNIPVIHIIRKNLLYQYISSIVAEKTGKYHFKNNEKGLEYYQRIKINPNHCKFMMHRVKRNIKKHQGWFHKYPYYYQIAYEDLTHNGVFTNKLNNIVSTITKNEIIKLSDPPLKKGIKDPFEYIENKEQLFRVLKESVFAGYLN